MQVNWAGAFSVTKKPREQPQECHLSWVELCKPTTSSRIRANCVSIEAIRAWFNKLQCSANPEYFDALDTSDLCLFVHGPSGVWKSSAVSLCGSEHGFDVVHTYSDVQRTPQKLDAMVREVGMSDGRGVLVLDEFESFIKETTSLKWLSKFLRSKERVPVVIVCNALDKCFHHIREISTIVEFQPYTTDEMYASLLRLSHRVRLFCHLPPMDCYFIAGMCSGNLCQTVNQLQMLYFGSKPLKPGRKRQKLGRVRPKCMQDSTVKMWSNSHRATSVDCFVHDSGFLESVAGMNREFLVGLGENLVREYPTYFHNGSMSTLDVVAACVENLSAADCGLGSQEQNEDRLYETQNSDQWAGDNINFMGNLCACLRLLQSREKSTIVLPRKSAKRVFEYGNSWESLVRSRTKAGSDVFN